MMNLKCSLLWIIAVCIGLALSLPIPETNARRLARGLPPNPPKFIRNAPTPAGTSFPTSFHKGITSEISMCDHSRCKCKASLPFPFKALAFPFQTYAFASFALPFQTDLDFLFQTFLGFLFRILEIALKLEFAVLRQRHQRVNVSGVMGYNFFVPLIVPTNPRFQHLFLVLA
jgi:hypothetical protein